MRPQDLGSVENGSPQRLLGLRQVTRFAVARDALEGDSGWASTSKSCAPRGRRSRTSAGKACRFANEATSKAKYCNAGFAKNTSSTDPCLRMAAQKGTRAMSSRIPADLPVDVMDASGGFLFGECTTTKLLNLRTT